MFIADKFNLISKFLQKENPDSDSITGNLYQI